MSEVGLRLAVEKMCDTIDDVLRQYNAPGRVTGGRLTPYEQRFKVIPEMGTRVGAIKRLASELAIALEVPQVRVELRGAAVEVVIQKETAATVYLLDELEFAKEEEDIPHATAFLGVMTDGAPLWVRLPSPDVAHVQVAGSTGSGKTSLLKTMILSLAVLNKPRELRLVVIDPRGTLSLFNGLPHLARPLVTDPQEAIATLNRLVAMMEKRDRARATSPTIILVVDELADLMMAGGRLEAEVPLTRLLQRGRGAGIHAILATQKPTVAVLGSLVKANIPVRIVGRVTTPQEAYIASGWPGSGAERLKGRGDFIAVAEGRLHRFQAAYAPDDAIEEALQAQGWDLVTQGSVPLLTPPSRDEDSVLEGEVLSVCVEQQEEETVEALARRLQPWWEEHGGKYGAKSGAVRFLFGDDAPTAGYFWNVTMEAIALLEAEEEAVVEVAATSTSTSTSTSTPVPLYLRLLPRPPRDI